MNPHFTDEHLDAHPMIQMAFMIPMQGVRSVSPLRVFRFSRQELIQPRAWAETDYQMGVLEPTAGEDRLGPIPVVAVGEVTDPDQIIVGSLSLLTSAEAEQAEVTEPELTRKNGSKIIVFGSSSLISNAMVAVGANLDLFLNSIAWLVGEEAQLSERA